MSWWSAAVGPTVARSRLLGRYECKFVPCWSSREGPDYGLVMGGIWLAGPHPAVPHPGWDRAGVEWLWATHQCTQLRRASAALRRL